MRTIDREGGAAAAPRRRGCLRLGCLAKGGLGCASFAVGALAVFVALLPAAAGSVLSAVVEEAFAEEHQGTLDVGEVRLSWISPQRVEGITLRDARSAYVGSAEISMPPMLDLIEGLDRGVIGPVRIDLDASLHAGDDGTWNLERALARRDPPAADGAERAGIERRSQASNATFEADLEATVGIWRASWSSPALRAAGRQQVVVVLDEGRLFLPEVGVGRLEARGRLEDEVGGDEPRPLSLAVELGSLARVLGRRERPLRWEWTVEGLPADLLGALAPASGIPCVEAFGERIGSVRLARLPDAGEVYELAVRGTGARVDLGATVADGIASGSARADFTLAGFWRDAVVLRLLPFLGDLRPEEEGAVARIEMSAFTLPRHATLAELTGDLKLDLGRVRYAVLPGAGPGAGTGPALVSAPGTPVPPVRLALADGIARLAPLSLPVTDGELELAGTIDLATGAFELTATASGAAAERLAGAPEKVVVQVRGGADGGVTVVR